MQVTKNKLLDIDYLKANHTRIYYFGLGFIQVVLNKYERIHFYTDELAKYTKSRTPVRVVYQDFFDTKSDAAKEEYRIKKLTRTEKIKLICSK